MTVVEVNGRDYRIPTQQTSVWCLDGCDPAYLEDAFRRGLLPRMSQMVSAGTFAIGEGQIPSFTNPNNLSIVTGAPPVVHGLPGNHYLAPDGSEVQLTSPEFLRAPSIYARMAEAGAPVLAVTTKNKLRALLGNGGVRTFSAELAHEQELDGVPVTELVGHPNPGIYDWDCSHYALEMGLVLAQRLGAVLTYVSLTDFVQHSDAPGGSVSDEYLVRLDELVGAYLDAGFALGLVADHGMNDKSLPDGSPRVRYLGDALAKAGVVDATVILPITDPYVVHHAALGSACWVHVGAGDLERARGTIAGLDGIEEVLDREVAAVRFQLPADRIGDLFVLADRETALGKSAAEHDLAALHGPLRSHGGLHERAVPMLFSEPMTPAGNALLAGGASNADVHHLLLNESARTNGG
jgi:phosphonoacetate hydrolase